MVFLSAVVVYGCDGLMRIMPDNGSLRGVFRNQPQSLNVFEPIFQCAKKLGFENMAHVAYS